MSGIAGLLFVAFSFLAAGMNVSPPAYDEDAGVVAAWLANSAEAYRRWHFIAGLAFLLFYFPFFAGFCEKLRQAEGTPATWSRVAWAGAVISPAAGTTSGAFIMGAALSGQGVSPEAAKLALAAQHYAYVVSGAYTGTIMTGASVVILRTGVFWRWLGWAGALIAVAAVAGSAAIVTSNPQGFFVSISNFAWLAYFLWIAAVSFAMLQNREAPTDDT